MKINEIEDLGYKKYVIMAYEENGIKDTLHIKIGIEDYETGLVKATTQFKTTRDEVLTWTSGKRKIKQELNKAEINTEAGDDIIVEIQWVLDKPTKEVINHRLAWYTAE